MQSVYVHESPLKRALMGTTGARNTVSSDNSRRWRYLDLIAPAENSTEAAPLKVVGRPFARGVSGSPGGRPKGLRAYVKDRTNNLHDQIDFLMNLQNDESQPTKLRLDAARELLDRGIGKALNSSIVVSKERAAERDPIGELSFEEKVGVLAARREAAGAIAGNGDAA